jgi:hypothetical protein
MADPSDRQKPPEHVHAEEVPPPELEPEVQKALGLMFQKYCDEMVGQPVPDKFAVLLARLEAKERGRDER